jgi:hypothetical protein
MSCYKNAQTRKANLVPEIAGMGSNVKRYTHDEGSRPLGDTGTYASAIFQLVLRKYGALV